MIVEKVRSVWTRGREAGSEHASEDADEHRSSTPDSKLFRCPTCDVVYLALEKEVCSSCRGEVREVSPSLSGS